MTQSFEKKLDGEVEVAYADAEDEHVDQPASQLPDPLQPATGDGERDHAPQAPATFAIVYPLNRLGDQELRKTIVVRVEWDDAEIVMSNDKLRIWGAGADIYGALDDFARTFNSVLSSYRETPREELTQRASAYLEELTSYLP